MIEIFSSNLREMNFQVSVTWVTNARQNGKKHRSDLAQSLKQDSHGKRGRHFKFKHIIMGTIAVRVLDYNCFTLYLPCKTYLPKGKFSFPDCCHLSCYLVQREINTWEFQIYFYWSSAEKKLQTLYMQGMTWRDFHRTV